MARMYYEEDAALESLSGKKLAVLGYGSQGRAQALCLRDSGMDVCVGLRLEGKSWAKAERDGFEVLTVSEAVKQADVVQMLLPDERQAEVWEESVRDNLREGTMLMFSHGFSIHFGRINVPESVDVAMVAPKGPGDLVRETYECGSGVPALFAVEQDASGKARELALAYAKAIGATRSGVLETSFREETETDLFGEQAVLCGGVTELVKAGYETLVDAGYQKELAYFECLHELKLIVDLMYERGIAGMHEVVSNTAKYGSYSRGRRVVGEESRRAMRELLSEVQDGSFAEEWVGRGGAYERGALKEYFERDMQHPMEEVGRKLRSQMSWLQDTPKKEDEVATCTVGGGAP